jgi:HPt (histidine-containing phosphotransfer) domain-containing protein
METPNLNYIKELSGDDEDFKNSIVLVIKNELPKEIETYRAFIGQQDYKMTSEVVHKLKHKVSVLGLEQSYQVADEFEIALRQNDATLHKNFEEILEVMQDYINKL